MVKLSEKFICEKICFKNELTKSYKGREVLNAFKREMNKTPLTKRQTMVVFLNWKGDVLHKVSKAKSAGKLAQYMKLALKKNKKMVAEAAAEAAAKDPTKKVAKK